MRIISGKWKGHRLVSFHADHIRPTTDRVKETLFNILKNDVPGARVADLYSGTGNLGFEALSRGADYVEMVELNRSSLNIIKSNLKHLGVKDGVRVVAKDVFRYIQSYKGQPFDLVFIDPPFTKKWAHKTMETLANSKVCRAGGLVIIEAAKHERIDAQYGKFHLLDRREFGDKSASIYQLEASKSGPKEDPSEE